MPPPDLWLILIRLLCALAIGAIVGYERERARKPAGLRTLTLVAFGACLFALLTMELIDDWSGTDGVMLDPVRVVAGLIGGIGFLGGGAIIQDRSSVEGVTTAAAIWVVGALGLACGMGSLWLAGVGAGVTILVLWLLGFVENRLLHRATDGDDPAE